MLKNAIFRSEQINESFTEFVGREWPINYCTLYRKRFVTFLRVPGWRSWRSMASDSFVLLPDQMYGAANEDTDGGGCGDNGGVPPF